ncbi:MAG: cation:proton antiporter [Methanomicrobiaceae archaeon]|nr:cation:proton antiporter [Methanomicrobiaceae archaeon]
MEFLFAIIVLLATAKLFGEIVERLGYPSMVGEIAAGIVLGPALFGIVVMDATMEIFSDIGIIVLLFISGVELNLAQLIRGRAVAGATAAAGVIVPFAFGLAAGFALGFSTHESLFLAITLSITSIGISIRSLIDLKQLTTPVGTTIVSAAVLDDIIGIILLAGLTALTLPAGTAFASALTSLALGGLFLLVFATLGRRIMVRLFALARKTETHEMLYSIALLTALLAAYLSHLAGLHYAIGAFIAGLILGDQIRIDRPLLDSIMDFGFGFFVTIFFASIGLLFSFTEAAFESPQILILIVVIVVLAILGKLIGGFIGSAAFLDRKDALLVGLGMCPRGEIALVVAKISLAIGIITADLYSAVTVMVIVSIVATPLLLTWGFKGRNASETPTPAE